MAIADVFEYAQDMFMAYYGATLSGEAYKKIEEMCTVYGVDEVEQAIYIVCERYEDKVVAFRKIGGVLFNRRKMNKKYFE